ncbi:CRISPR system precrRNA processing endoribonuclease RAMP protein Cas6 [bacterium]|nr:CRISPR system precrRNA processing endoribonuclease RAMP protein Cas6 [bacterium]
MLSFLNDISLIRYLIVWRVNGSLAFLGRYPSLDLSRVVGAIIVRRLPTRERKSWQKALPSPGKNAAFDSRQKQSEKIPETSWPIESVLFTYPGKKSYGRDELIFWELKLFGKCADHGLFLELILPAMEEAGYTSDPAWKRRNRLWGKFDICHIYVARGNRWEPLVTDGRLNLRYQASPTQWTEDLSRASTSRFKNLTWLTPFKFRDEAVKIPTLSSILDELSFRIDQLIKGQSKRLVLDSDRGAGNILSSEEGKAFQEAYEKAASVPIIREAIRSVPKTWPGRWIGRQQFSSIPDSIIPYLEIASIIHIGKQTHFGCGTFAVS